jgi:hypothetical protein
METIAEKIRPILVALAISFSVSCDGTNYHYSYRFIDISTKTCAIWLQIDMYVCTTHVMPLVQLLELNRKLIHKGLLSFTCKLIKAYFPSHAYMEYTYIDMNTCIHGELPQE